MSQIEANAFAEEILTPEESRAFVYNMLHPNAEVIARRDDFLADLVLTHNTDGSIEAELKEVSYLMPLSELPKEANTDGDSKGWK